MRSRGTERSEIERCDSRIGVDLDDRYVSTASIRGKVLHHDIETEQDSAGKRFRRLLRHRNDRRMQPLDDADAFSAHRNIGYRRQAHPFTLAGNVRERSAIQFELVETLYRVDFQKRIFEAEPVLVGDKLLDRADPVADDIGRHTANGGSQVAPDR